MIILNCIKPKKRKELRETKNEIVWIVNSTKENQIEDNYKSFKGTAQGLQFECTEQLRIISSKKSIYAAIKRQY